MNSVKLVSTIVIFNALDDDIYMSLRSVVNQTYQRVECIIIDNTGTNNICNAIDDFIALENFKYIKNTASSEVSAVNLGLSIAKGDYIQILSAPNILMCDKIEKQINIIKNANNSGCVISYCGSSFCTDADIDDEVAYDDNFGDTKSNNSLLDVSSRWGENLFIPMHAWLFDSRIFFDNDIEFDEKLTVHWYTDFIYRIIMNRVNIVFLSEKCVACRIDMKFREQYFDLRHKEWYEVLMKYRSETHDFIVKSAIDKRVCKTNLQNGKFFDTRKCISSNPLVSIIVTSYNYEKYIEECIRSVFNQTYRNVELVIVDDGSTDRSVELINRLIKESEFTVKTIFTSNNGQANAMNEGFKASEGEIISFLDSDDYFYDNRVEYVLAFMHLFPYASIYQHQMKTSNGIKRGGLISGDIYSLWNMWSSRKFNIADDHDGLLFSPFLPTSGLVFKRSTLDVIFPIPTSLTTCPDAYITRTSIREGSLISIPVELGFWRNHGENAGAQGANSFKNFWLPRIMPEINRFYERHNIPFMIYYDLSNKSHISASRVLGEHTKFKKENVDIYNRLNTPFKRIRRNIISIIRDLKFIFFTMLRISLR